MSLFFLMTLQDNYNPYPLQKEKNKCNKGFQAVKYFYSNTKLARLICKYYLNMVEKTVYVIAQLVPPLKRYNINAPQYI